MTARKIPSGDRMINHWNEAEEAAYVARYGSAEGTRCAAAVYLTALLASEPRLGWSSGGSVSVKTRSVDLSGDETRTLLLTTGTGVGMEAKPDDFWEFDLDYLEKLGNLDRLTQEAFRCDEKIRIWTRGRTCPPAETLAHAFIQKPFVIHAHAWPILILSWQEGAHSLVPEALGTDVALFEHVRSGMMLVKSNVPVQDSIPSCCAVLWRRDGIVTWGETAREAYESLVRLVEKAESYLETRQIFPMVSRGGWEKQAAMQRFARIAPILRGLLAQPTGLPDRPYSRVVLAPWIDQSVLDFMQQENARELAFAPCTVPDYAGCFGAGPLWIDNPDCESVEGFREQFSGMLKSYLTAEDSQGAHHEPSSPSECSLSPRFPRVIYLRGIGAICAGESARTAQLMRELTIQEVAVKCAASLLGTYRGTQDREIAGTRRVPTAGPMPAAPLRPLDGHVALVTGAAGAIGAAICEELLSQGCNVAITDLPGEHLVGLAEELKKIHGPQVTMIPLDVTDGDSVSRGFAHAVGVWGGIDLLVVNAGLAHVASLEEMNLDSFRRLSKVNIEGTLLLLREAGRQFRLQGTGGDVILVSTKNVFSPGARFGAYSATKAASHQLARIASLEFAGMDVRVNMVAPDAVFSHGSRKSGLWAEVGPDRMRARGLSEEGLEEYYRGRNLLKARITANHVAKAVLFFASRQTPTTGATLPVDGGLPDATPR